MQITKGRIQMIQQQLGLLTPNLPIAFSALCNTLFRLFILFSLKSHTTCYCHTHYETVRFINHRRYTIIIIITIINYITYVQYLIL